MATAECRAELLLDDVSCTRVWKRFQALDPPLGYDGADIPMWSDGPTSPAFGALRLEPWFLRVFPAIYGATNGAEGAIRLASSNGTGLNANEGQDPCRRLGQPDHQPVTRRGTPSMM